MYAGYVHPDFTQVADVFQRQLPPSGRGGAALCVYHRGEMVVNIYGGSRDTKGTPWTADTLALSYSTTKGVVSTLLHILASRGEVDYDAPVARYWPQFAENAKSRITVRQLLCHEAGLYSIRSLITDANAMRDWDAMLRVMEQAPPAHVPGARNGYHALTYGWLVGGLIEKISGQPLAAVLKKELADPLQLDGCFIGVPDADLARCAELIVAPRKPIMVTKPTKKRTNWPQKIISLALRLSGFDDRTIQEAMMPKGISRYDWNAKESVQACLPGMGGMFTANSLAKIYATLSNGGELEGTRIMSRDTAARLAEVQNTRRGAVVPLAMRWRLGYHRVFTTGPRTPQAFGHFGYGGSGAWCDPARQLAVGYVVNRGAGTPFGDSRLAKINTATIRAAEAIR